MYAKMKSFSERNPVVIGVVGVGLVSAGVLAALQYDKLALVSGGNDYKAYFAEAGACALATRCRSRDYG